ncbi:MAG TPA: hypothetical protein VFG54_01220 [Prolixibacteraceae bacterium]|nr:hypothetical protein [Prolixibacteraceae bacterium]
MKAFFILLVLFIVLSCKTNHYLSEPINGCPNLGLQANLNSNGILVASNYNLTVDTAHFEGCLEGLTLNVQAKSKIRFVDEIYFEKRPNTAILKELRENYMVDGLLLLTNLRIQKKGYDVESKKIYYIQEFMEWPGYYGTIPWTNLYVKIISQWEYHDFTTGRSYQFSTANDKLFEFGEYVPDLDAYLETNNVFAPLLYLNGELTANNLTGVNH